MFYFDNQKIGIFIKKFFYINFIYFNLLILQVEFKVEYLLKSLILWNI